MNKNSENITFTQFKHVGNILKQYNHLFIHLSTYKLIHMNKNSNFYLFLPIAN